MSGKDERDSNLIYPESVVVTLVPNHCNQWKQSRSSCGMSPLAMRPITPFAIETEAGFCMEIWEHEMTDPLPRMGKNAPSKAARDDKKGGNRDQSLHHKCLVALSSRLPTLLHLVKHTQAICTFKTGREYVGTSVWNQSSGRKRTVKAAATTITVSTFTCDER